MRKPCVIFDRSAFHRNSFSLLRRSNLRNLVNRHAITVYHTPPFLQETINLYFLENRRNELKEQLPFIYEICNGRWFKERELMWSEMLVGGKLQSEVLFYGTSEQHLIEKNIAQMVFEDDCDEIVFNEVLHSTEQARTKAGGLRETLIKMRNDVAARLKVTGKSPKDIKQTWQAYTDRSGFISCCK